MREEIGITEEERRSLYWLTRIPGFGPVSVSKIWNSMKKRTGIYNIEGKKLAEQGLIKPAQAAAFDQARTGASWERIQGEFDRLERERIRFLTPFDQDYPKSLKVLEDRPMGLFVKGRLPEEERPTAAIVGARECSGYGIQVARFFGRELSAKGIQIISGLAAGVDGAGNRGALEAGAATYGVLGCGINICYPREHYPLWEEMTRKGGVLSEYGPGEPPKPGNFPMRNRIISGLAQVVLVIEARERSGSLITAGLALEQGKDVFAVPGRITDSLSMGCNRLIQSGAAPLLGPEDVFDYFGLKHGNLLRIEEKNQKGLAKNEKKVYICLDLQPKFIEEIAEECGLAIHECIRILLDLELRGMIVQEANHYYRKKL